MYSPKLLKITIPDTAIFWVKVKEQYDWRDVIHPMMKNDNPESYEYSYNLAKSLSRVL